jgi:hypothetical protein
MGPKTVVVMQSSRREVCKIEDKVALQDAKHTVIIVGKPWKKY